MKTDWIICRDGTHGDKAYQMECLRCGAVQRVATPISIACYLAMTKAFAKLHRRCKERIPKVSET